MPIFKSIQYDRYGEPIERDAPRFENFGDHHDDCIRRQDDREHPRNVKRWWGEMWEYLRMIGEIVLALFVGALVAFLVLIFGAMVASAQNVILPVYDAPLGEKALLLCPKGRERELTFIVNPNSGPGSSRDTAMHRLISGANARRVHVLYYIDLMALPGDGLTPPTSKPHVKTPAELVNERRLYSRWYGSLQWDGWFFDDVRPTMNESFLCIANWPGTKVLNPGCSWQPPGPLRSAVVVISEQAKAWPRTLSTNEEAHRAEIAVMGLSIRAAELPRFLTTTKGMAYRYASDLDDRWQNGKSAYSSLTPYFGRLFK